MSRSQLLAELRRVRRQRDRLALSATQPLRPDQGAGATAQLEALFQVCNALLSAPSLAEAVPTVLVDLAELGGWDAAMLWLTGESDGTLHFVGAWHGEGVNGGSLVSLSRQTTFRAGRSPLGSLWGQDEQPGLYDLRLDGRSPRAFYAVEAGLEWGCYFPLWHQQRLLGFFEFLGADLTPPSAELRKVVSAAGHQVLERLLRERLETRVSTADALASPIADFAVYELDAAGRVLRWNRDAERLKGFSADDVLGQHISMFYPAHEGQHAASNLATAAARGFLKHVGWRVRKGSGPFWADVLIMPKRAAHGELVGYTKVVHGLSAPEAATAGAPPVAPARRPGAGHADWPAPLITKD